MQNKNFVVKNEKLPKAIIIHNKVRIFHFDIIFNVNLLWKFSAPSIILFGQQEHMYIL